MPKSMKAMLAILGGPMGGKGRSCPECGSDDLVKNNKRVMASGLVKIQYKCKTCNKMHSKTDK